MASGDDAYNEDSTSISGTSCEGHATLSFAPWLSGCHAKYVQGRCSLPSCSDRHDLTCEELGTFQTWNDEKHVVFQSSAPSSASNSTSSQSSAKVADVLSERGNDGDAQCETADEELLGMVPQDPAGPFQEKGTAGETTSIGSVLHASGQCRSCAYFVATQPCAQGMRCGFCHLSHNTEAAGAQGDRKEGNRPSRTQRDRYNRLVQRMKEDIQLDPFGWTADRAEIIQYRLKNNPDAQHKYLMHLAVFQDAAKSHCGASSSSAAGSARYTRLNGPSQHQA